MTAADYVADIIRNERPVYGVSTGVGHFADVLIPPGKISAQQRNLIRSHCCGVGKPLGRDIVMAMCLIRLNTITLGRSGTRPETVAAIIQLLESGALPEVPSRGSVGASGDLAPSAHAALSLLGEGWCTVPEGGSFNRVTAQEALTRAGLKPLKLAAKEGLSLINGTQLTTALALKAWYEGAILLRTANLAAAMTFEALHGSRSALDPRVLALHRHEGTLHVGKDVLGWLDGESAIHDTHFRIKWAQDPYSLRCIPQVHGAVWDELEQAERVLQEEINAAADNPLLFPEAQESLSCGNFHAIYVARVSDKLVTAFTTLASISERRINLAMSSRRTGLPDFLIDDGGVQSGFMMAQVTAAALVSECKALSFPASVDSIPTNNDQEDHVSMGPVAGFKALEVVEKLRQVLAIELMVSAQALDFRHPHGAAPRLQAVHERIRADVAHLAEDRVLATDIALIEQRIAEEAYLS
ncbi:MAG: histidine ammonia-lyase [Gammaproteobacteria bacterium]|nr:histidine ammonia-lyase [Gammaproteobacteria bacterium]